VIGQLWRSQFREVLLHFIMVSNHQQNQLIIPVREQQSNTQPETSLPDTRPV